MASRQCPLGDREFLQSVQHIQLHHLNKIATHVTSSSCYCSLQLPLKDFVFSEGSIKGTTPLILACKNGELDLVKHLIEIWLVNVNAAAKYSTTNINTDFKMELSKASPLFVAAVHGHNHIVRYLLEKGAEVSVKTWNAETEKGTYAFKGLTALTPLYGAVSYLYLNSRRPLLEQQKERSAIVRSLLEFGADPIADPFRPSDEQPMWMETMCGADAITALINHGLDLKRRNPLTGVTLLHHIVVSRKLTEEDSLAIVQLLVGRGADLLARDKKGFTPLLRAANHKNDAGRLNFSILDFLLERDEYSRLEKIEAMELAGARILENAQHFPKAFDYWRRSLYLRHQMETVEESGSSSKKILGRKIGIHVEWTTFAEIDKLVLHPEDFQIQALLVQLRIISDLDDHHLLSSIYIANLSKSKTLKDHEKFTQILDILWGRFDVMITRLDSLPTDSAFWTLVEGDVDELISTLSTLGKKHLLSFEKLKTSLDLILLATDQSPIEMNDRIFNLLTMIFRLPTMLNKHESTSMAKSLRLLGTTLLGHLLHSACFYLEDSKSYLVHLVRVLLEAGADPNVAVDGDNAENSSLHFAAMVIDRKLGDAACLLLVEFGAKLHQVNKAGKTALDIWIEINETEDKWNEEAGGKSIRPEWCCPLPTLLRLAARVIRIHKIPYADGETPANLYPLIELR